jgi:RNA polymerase sigma factor (sigma-70 family)
MANAASAAVELTDYRHSDDCRRCADCRLTDGGYKGTLTCLMEESKTIASVSGIRAGGHASDGANAQFTTTHWSVVLNARNTDSSQGAGALEQLCRTYWYPLYAFVRREGYSHHDAEDLTQGFFERLLAKNYLAQVDQTLGRFRSFLLASLKHYLSDRRDHQRAVKRGGGKVTFSFDSQTAEELYQLEPGNELTAESIFERRWALTVLDEARRHLRKEYVAAGKAELHARLRIFEAGDAGLPSYAEVGAALGLSESAVKSAAYRLRQRFRELVRAEIAQTVHSPEEIDDEIRHLLAVIGRS